MQKSIVQAAALLEAKGYQLVRGLPYDLANMTARYEIRMPGGQLREVTSADIAAIIS